MPGLSPVFSFSRKASFPISKKILHAKYFALVKDTLINQLNIILCKKICVADLYNVKKWLYIEKIAYKEDIFSLILLAFYSWEQVLDPLP